MEPILTWEVFNAVLLRTAEMEEDDEGSNDVLERWGVHLEDFARMVASFVEHALNHLEEESPGEQVMTAFVCGFTMALESLEVQRTME